jgi:hypothetical protein
MWCSLVTHHMRAQTQFQTQSRRVDTKRVEPPRDERWHLQALRIQRARQRLDRPLRLQRYEILRTHDLSSPAATLRLWHNRSADSFDSIGQFPRKMAEIPKKIARIPDNAIARISVKCVLNPCLWFMGVVTLPSLCVAAWSDGVVQIVCLAVAWIPIAVFAAGFCYFAITDPDRLRSED